MKNLALRSGFFCPKKKGLRFFRTEPFLLLAKRQALRLLFQFDDV